MTGAGGRRCGLCDLPFTQCAHGYERKKARAAKKAEAVARRGTARVADTTAGEAKRKKRTKKAQDLTAGTSTSRTSPPDAAPCTRCRRHPRYRRYRLCRACWVAAGWVMCRRCRQHFAPGPGRRLEAICNRCVRKGGGGSVWITASAGAPGLGRRR